MSNKLLIAIYIAILFSTSIYANGDVEKMDKSIEIRLLDESISYPNPLPKIYEFNPAVFVGLEIPLKQNGRHSFSYRPNLTLFYHQSWEWGIMLHTDLLYRYKMKRFGISPSLGAGYGHDFSLLPEYIFEDGEYVKRNPFGTSKLSFSFGLNLEYELNQKSNLVLSLSQVAQVPFSAYGSAHQFLGLGYRFKLNKKAS